MLFRSAPSAPVPVTLQCHFCLSSTQFGAGAVPSRPGVSSPRTRARSGQNHSPQHRQNGFKWLCERCHCWNGWDRDGETMTDHAAMHNELENKSSFLKRGMTPSTSFPTPASSSKSPFCMSCTTNHSLIINLLAQYLPDDSDPSYPELLARLPEYKASVFERYPPLCVKCEPVAEEAIARGDYRAKTSALNGFLNRSRSPHLSQQDGGDAARVPPAPRRKLYGTPTSAFWISSSILNISLLAYALYYACPPLSDPSILPPPGFLLGLNVASIGWIGWDPLAAVAAKRPAGWVKRQRVARKQQMISLYLLRTFTAMIVVFSQSDWVPAAWFETSILLRVFLGVHLALELVAVLHVCLNLLFPPPPPLRPIRLVRPPSQPQLQPQPTQLASQSPPSPLAQQPDPNPSFTSQVPSTLDTFGRPHHPLFGAAPTWPSNPQPSTYQYAPAQDVEMEDVSRPSSAAYGSRPAGLEDAEGEDETWKLFNKAPTVFGPEEPTGLERLVEGWGLGEAAFGASTGTGIRSEGSVRKGGWFGGLFGSGSALKED